MEPRGLRGDSIYLVISGTVAIVSLPEEGEEEAEGEAASGTAGGAGPQSKRPSSSKSEDDFCLEGDMPGTGRARAFGFRG